MSSITHSGLTFISLGERNGMTVWPISEYLVRRKHGRKVAERIARLNPTGKPEGEWPKGWHPHARAYGWNYDCLTTQGFIRKFGRDKYWALPREAFMQTNGKRNRISMTWVANNL